MTSLDKLAERCGIQSSALDVFGKEHSTTPELKRALLQAMRFDVDNDKQAEMALERLEGRDWGRPLPPVLVAYKQAGPVDVPITLPADSGEFSWILVLEDGTERSGRTAFGELALLGERELRGDLLQRRSLLLPRDIPWGYHRMTVDEADVEMMLVVTPGRCWLPRVDDDSRFWGISASLFLLRSEQNWGIGDFTDLRELVALVKSRSGDAVGLNPLHAMFLDKPADASPYSPSDRTLLNVLNIDIEAIPELAQSEQAQQSIAAEQFQEKLASCRDAQSCSTRQLQSLN